MFVFGLFVIVAASKVKNFSDFPSNGCNLFGYRYESCRENGACCNAWQCSADPEARAAHGVHLDGDGGSVGRGRNNIRTSASGLQLGHHPWLEVGQHWERVCPRGRSQVWRDVKINLVKVVVLGAPGVGKTSIVKVSFDQFRPVSTNYDQFWPIFGHFLTGFDHKQWILTLIILQFLYYWFWEYEWLASVCSRKWRFTLISQENIFSYYLDCGYYWRLYNNHKKWQQKRLHFFKERPLKLAAVKIKAWRLVCEIWSFHKSK